MFARAESAYFDKVRSFVKRSPSLTPQEAAHEWLGLLEAGHAVPRRPFTKVSHPIFVLNIAVRALPRPGVWTAIVETLSRARPTQENKLLLLLFARLQGHEGEVLRLCKELPGLETVRLHALQRSRDLPNMLRQIETSFAQRYGTVAVVPDLACLLGVPQAKSELLRFAQTAKQPLRIKGHASRELAKEVVLANLSSIDTPQWGLAAEMRDAPYLRSLVAHYGVESLLSHENASQAKSIYFADLMVRGEALQAAEMLRRIKYAPYDSGPHPRMWSSLYEPVSDLQTLVPEVDLWWLYADAAKASGHAREAADRIEAALRDPGTKSDLRYTLHVNLIRLHGALGDTKALARDARIPIDGPVNYSHRYRYGYALEDPDLIREFVDARLAHPDAAWDIVLVDELISQRRFREVESLVTQSLSQQEGTDRLAGNGDRYGYRLCRLYYAEKRPEEIVRVLREFPYWPSTELDETLTVGPYGRDSQPEAPYPPLGFYAAWALAKTGRLELALQVLRRTLFHASSCDEVYELLNELGGPDTLKFYDDLSALNPLEPRPLIWKAALLLKYGRLQEAEKWAREAIALDPSDGRAHPSRRFRVYEILAEIQGAKGDSKAAAASMNRFKAARLAEKAEDLAGARLFPQAASLFEDSIELSPRDYVVEERFAQCLDAAGQWKAAIAHHKRAYELMAEGFGWATEIEPDCRDMLSDPELMALGAPILSSLASKVKSNASAATLYGVVQEQSGNPRGAVESFRQAVRLDPKFIEAWDHLASLGFDGFLSQAEAEAAEYAILELNPLSQGRRWSNFARVRDLANLYRKVVEVERKLPDPPEAPVFPLRSARDRDAEPGFPWPWRSLKRPPGDCLLNDDIGEIIRAYEVSWIFGGRRPVGPVERVTLGM